MQISPTIFDFLKDLARNNNREWFNNHKDRYQTAHAAMIDFADALLDEMNSHDELVPMTGKQSLFRIYRDVRFSKNKEPYKTSFSGRMKRATDLLRQEEGLLVEPSGWTRDCQNLLTH